MEGPTPPNTGASSSSESLRPSDTWRTRRECKRSANDEKGTRPFQTPEAWWRNPVLTLHHGWEAPEQSALHRSSTGQSADAQGYPGVRARVRVRLGPVCTAYTWSWTFYHRLPWIPASWPSAFPSLRAFSASFQAWFLIFLFPSLLHLPPSAFHKVTEKANHSVPCPYSLRGPSGLDKAGPSQFLPNWHNQPTSWLHIKTISNGLLDLG